MTRIMYDSVNANAIPVSAGMVAGYINGPDSEWSPADWARFPQAVKVRITVTAAVNDGHVLDVEKGDATPQQAPGWVVMRRQAGADPTVYCSESALPDLEREFVNAKVPFPHWWTAAYNTPPNPAIPVNRVAHQYVDTGPFDLSTVLDHWPGVDDGTQPLPTGDAMNPTDNAAVWVVPGTGGGQRFELHRDGGLYTFGAVNPLALRYTAYTNMTAEEYDFPAAGGIFSFPGLVNAGLVLGPDGKPSSGWPNRFFVAMHVYSYNGVNYETAASGPPGPPGPVGPQGPQGIQGPQGPVGVVTGGLPASVVADLDRLDKDAHGS